MGILQVFTLLGALGMFLYGMNLMSSGLQKVAGEKLRTLLSAMTSNPFKGVLTGLGVTTVISISSVVFFVIGIVIVKDCCQSTAILTFFPSLI